MNMFSRTRRLVGRTSAVGAVTMSLFGCSGGSGGIDLPAGVGGTAATVGGSSNGGTATNQQQGGAQSPSTGGATTNTPQGGSQNGEGGAGAGGVVTGNGGATGGTSKGGSSSGGTATGGAAPTVGGATAGGASSKGGSNAGGTAAGGASKGGSSNGGTATGGAATTVGGATSKGGASNGGTATGGAATAIGGKATGGATAATGGAPTTTGNEIWISPTGSDSNPGTKASPMFSFCDTSAKTGACYKLCPSGGTCTGGTIWAMTGTYSYKAVQKTGSAMTGSASAPLNLFAEAGATPVFDFTGMAVGSDNRGLQLAGTYWHIKGLTVTKAGDTGIMVMGANITVEQCIAHHNADAGIVIGVNSSQAGSGMNNLILNCDSYQNNDAANGGENADGFGMKENSGTGNVFRGCRAWDNADDGWDLYAWASPVTIDNCWAISQCKSTKGSNSDGNGFKLGGDGVSAKHILSNLYSTDNAYGTSKRGFTNNSNPASMSCSSCASWSNGAADTGVSGVGTSAPGSATAAKMIAAKRNADGSLPAITSL